MSSDTGTLYAIGVGPGDPDFLTLKALKILKKIRFIFTAASGEKKKSLALTIALPHLKNKPEIIPLIFPMVRDKTILEEAWEKAALKVLSVLDKGEDAAFVTLGDPSTYSTFTYLHRVLTQKRPEVNVQIVPGITSFQAAAARVQIPLAEGEESLMIVSGAKGSTEIEKAIDCCDNMVIMKAYKYYRDIVDTLERLNLLDKTVAVRRIGLKGESVTNRLKEWDGQSPSYFTLLLTKKGNQAKKLDSD